VVDNYINESLFLRAEMNKLKYLFIRIIRKFSYVPLKLDRWLYGLKEEQSVNF
jgi:hypothetical protein